MVMVGLNSFLVLSAVASVCVSAVANRLGPEVEFLGRCEAGGADAVGGDGGLPGGAGGAGGGCLEASLQGRSVDAPQAGAGIPHFGGGIAGDTAEGVISRTGRAGDLTESCIRHCVELGIEEADGCAQVRVDDRDQACIEWGNGAGAAATALLAALYLRIAAYGTGGAGEVGKFAWPVIFWSRLVGTGNPFW